MGSNLKETFSITACHPGFAKTSLPSLKTRTRKTPNSWTWAGIWKCSRILSSRVELVSMKPEAGGAGQGLCSPAGFVGLKSNQHGLQLLVTLHETAVVSRSSETTLKSLTTVSCAKKN